MDLRLRVARELESGARVGALASLASRAYGALAASRVARPLRFDRASRILAIGGATLGGSGKTPLAIACAASLAASGARVALVGHAYRASVGGARVVQVDDDVAHVGDEALVAARALASRGVRVVVARSRQAALDHALRHADVVVLDGVAQTSPRRATLALLAVDAREPWGRAAACPPRGDLRAPAAALLAACDRVVAITDPLAPPPQPFPRAYVARVRAEGAHLASRFVSWAELRALRVGLVTSLARPARVTAHLARRGIQPVLVLSAADHAPPSAALVRRAASASVDLWLATAKCALHATSAPFAPLAILDYALTLDPALSRALRACEGLALTLRDAPDYAI